MYSCIQYVHTTQERTYVHVNVNVCKLSTRGDYLALTFFITTYLCWSHTRMHAWCSWSYGLNFLLKSKIYFLFGEYNPRPSICGRFKKLVQNLNRVNLANSIYKRSYRWSVSSGMYVGVDHWEHMFMFLLDPSLLFVIFV